MATKERKVTPPSAKRLSPQERKECILRAAARLLMGDDPSSLSAQRLAETLGITRHLIYHYYPDINDIIAEVVYREIESLRTAIFMEIKMDKYTLETLFASYIKYIVQHSPTAPIVLTVPRAVRYIKSFKERFALALYDLYRREKPELPIPSPIVRNASIAMIDYAQSFFLHPRVEVLENLDRTIRAMTALYRSSIDHFTRLDQKIRA